MGRTFVAVERNDRIRAAGVLRGKTVRSVSLGCKLNFSETATMVALLEECGAVAAADGVSADICIVNTCAVTEVAVSKCRRAIHRVIRENEGAIVVVTGCFAQLSPEVVASMDGVSLVVGTNEKGHLVDLLCSVIGDSAGSSGAVIRHTSTLSAITTFVPSCSRGNRTRYFLKVQDGCNYFCSYCTIPLARGLSRSATVDSVVRQAKQAVLQGAKELVLTGVNIGDFGRGTDETLLQLIQALDAIPGIERYRISSIEPNLLTDAIVRYCAEESKHFMPHFHIPLQSGSDTVLQLMRRRYTTAFFSEKIRYVRRLLPEAFIGVDVMVGCRGETEACFDETYAFLSSLDISQLHVFPYSERANTAALRIPYVVPESEKKRRTDLLLQLSTMKTRAFYSAFIGTVRPVLFEHTAHKSVLHGFTDNYLRVSLPLTPMLPDLDNTVRAVRLLTFNESSTTIECALE